MAARKYKASIVLHKFLRPFFSLYMKQLFNYSIVNRDILKSIKPPYIVLANHTNFWDPFLLSMCFPQPIYFVASDAYFRSPVLRLLLKLVGAIPKTKLVTDPGAIRGILQVTKNSGIIGIFPEGRRNWDGKTLPLLRPTAKLIKSLKIPVISVLFRGASLSMPRWSSGTRKGSLIMELSKVLDTNEIKPLTAGEIFARISDSLRYNEYDYQRMHMHKFTGKKKAEHLELFLFSCPECKSTDSMTSDADTFKCSACGYSTIYNSYGFFESDANKLYFNNPMDWNIWQLEHLHELASETIKSGARQEILREHSIILRTGSKSGSLSKGIDQGTLSLYPDMLVYSLGENHELQFPISDILGDNIQFNNQLEFISGGMLYRFSAKNGRMPAYKFVKAIEAIKSINRLGDIPKPMELATHNNKH